MVQLAVWAFAALFVCCLPAMRPAAAQQVAPLPTTREAAPPTRELPRTSGWEARIVLPPTPAVRNPELPPTRTINPAPRKPAEHVPAPKAASRAKPLREARTAMTPFESAPFPYYGNIPGTDRPFHDVEEEERIGHRRRNQILWQDEVFNDSRVLLHIPKGFDARKPGVILVYFHGHGATLERDVLRRQQVPAQISSSGINAVLVAPQFAVDAADSSAGKFWEPGGFGRFIGEAAQKLAELHGDKKTVRTFAGMPVVIVGYSGGYLPAAWAVHMGGLTNRIRGVVLLDGLYGELEKFTRWMAKDRSAFFVSAFTGSTERHHGELERLLMEQEIPVARALERQVKPGSVVFLSATTVNHRDFVTQAWGPQPIEDILRRVGPNLK
ncbi:MAG: alpha/beta hydrolase [Hyphomicrobiaceae bacterium]